VVEFDIKGLFDNIDHELLIKAVRKHCDIPWAILYIERWLKASMQMPDGSMQKRTKGTPQGGVISPLLSNILLDELDKELETRGHKFCRYADDCNVYVKSKEAGERVMSSLKVLLEKRLKLKVNEEKSKVERPWKRKFLGYTLHSSAEKIILDLASKSIRIL
jgi:RNA-directed DNA polymerase